MTSLRPDRRAFLLGAVTTGMISLVSGTLRDKLPRPSPGSGTLSIAVGNKAMALFTMLGSLYENRSGIAVTVEPAGDSATEQLNYMLENGRAGAIDVFGADVAHMAALANAGHLRRIPDDDPIGFLAAPLSTCRVPVVRADGYYALPFSSNIGMLFRREGVSAGAKAVRGLGDLLRETSTATWTAQLSPFFGDHGEGLLCNFFEHAMAVRGGDSVMTAEGGIIDDLGAWNAALDAIRRATPRRLHRCADDVRGLALFNGGTVEFMRNWPTFLHRSAGTERVIPSALLPLGTGILGGMNLAITTRSSKPDKSYDLLRFLTSPEVQKIVALYGYPPTVTGAYGDADLMSTVPYLQDVKESIKNARRRPPARQYADFSGAVVEVVVRCLTHAGERITDGDLRRWKSFL